MRQLVTLAAISLCGQAWGDGTPERQHAHATEATATADASVSQSQQQYQVNEQANAQSVTFEDEPVKLVIGGASSFTSDALQECHERTGVKNAAGVGAWGGRVTINDLCLRCSLLIRAGYPEECAKLVLEHEPARVSSEAEAYVAPVAAESASSEELRLCEERVDRAAAECGDDK